MAEIKYPSLASLSKCNILVTGATGLIGSVLVHTLMEYSRHYDYVVYALGRDAERAKVIFSVFENVKNFKFIQHDIIDKFECDIDFHYIINLASGASPNVMSTIPVDIMKANFLGTDNLLAYGITHRMKRFLYVSSGEIYGEGHGEMFAEDNSGYVNSMLSRSCYPSSKRAAETLCASYAAQYGINFVVARPCHIYGASFTESDNRVYAQFIRNVINGEDIILKSDGLQYRSWLYVKDCVAALLYILLQGENGEAYNVADEASNLSIREMAETVATMSSRRVVYADPSDNEVRGGSRIQQAIFRTNKLRALGWTPCYSFREAVKEIFEQIK